MDDVPDFAAVNETVAAAKACENPSVARVVNGVLRNLIRQRASVSLGTELETFPTALVRRWTARFGAECAERLAAWHNAPAVTCLARRDGMFTPLERGQKVPDVPGFSTGDFIVQDPGTRLAVALLDPQPGERILDACAAPGGKTVQLARRGADVTACEVNPRRRARLEENLRRLKLADVKVVESLTPETAPRPPASSPHPSSLFPRPSSFFLLPSSFPKVLVDAPCSNTGVFRRRPDARWNWNAEKLAELVRLQAEILDAAAAHVAPGGTLVYSTCSNEPEENGVQVAAFLKRHPDFTLRETSEAVPFETGHDGSFAAAHVRQDRSARPEAAGGAVRP